MSDFQVLPFNKQCDFITVFADYLVNRVTLDRKYYLYYLGGYFIEVCYLPLEGKVDVIEAFSDSKKLEQYLHEIEISELTV